MKISKTIARLLLTAICCCSAWHNVNGQALLTSYFMENSPMRMDLNPALAPNRGFFAIPAIGGVGVQVSSNVMGSRYFTEMLKEDSKADYFMSNTFYKHLKDRNYVNADVDLGIVRLGTWTRLGFISCDLGVRTSLEVRMPKSLFTFMRDMRGLDVNNIDYSKPVKYNIHDINLNLLSYADIGLGYANSIFFNHIKFGGKVKLLVGLGRMDARIDRMDIDLQLQNVEPNVDWSSMSMTDVAKLRGNADIDLDGYIDASFKGLEIESSEQVLDAIDIDLRKMGISGYGFAFDIGAAVKPIDHITFSASWTDIGFIKWKEKANVHEEVSGDVHYKCPDDNAKIVKMLSNGQVFNSDLLDNYVTRKTPKKESIRQSLTSNIHVGVQYGVFCDMLKLGALFKGHVSTHSYGELSLSGVFSALKLIDVAVSYNIIQSRGQSFGVAATIGPVFIGTDYMFLRNDSRVANAYFGLFIPLGSR